jgi:pimeloyl-ACP methyl ester carboxylesterase
MKTGSNGSARRSFELLDSPEVSRILFHPRRDPPNRPLPLRVRSLRIQVDEGIAVGARLHRASLDGPTILLFHGNGEIASDYDGISPLYTDLGINLLVADYRGYGSSDGQPTASHLLADAVTTYEQVGSILIEQELKAKPLLVMGRSLGSAAAIEIACHAGDGIAGLIIESGFAYTLPLLTTLGLRMGLKGADEAREGFGNLDKITQVHVPTLIIHGQDDWLIPVDNGHALYEHSGATDKRLVTIPHAGHNDLLFAGQKLYFDALRAFVASGDR